MTFDTQTLKDQKEGSNSQIETSMSSLLGILVIDVIKKLFQNYCNICA